MKAWVLLLLVLLGLGAVIAFSLFVIKPMQTRWAVNRARKIVRSGRLPTDWQFRNIYRMLATAHDDLEAAKLWRQIDGMIEASHNHHRQQTDRDGHGPDAYQPLSEWF